MDNQTRNTVVLTDVQVNSKIDKKTKKDKLYHLLQTSRGTVMSFIPRASEGITPSQNVVYDLEVEPPSDGYDSYTFVKLLGSRPHVPAPAPAQTTTAPAAPATSARPARPEYSREFAETKDDRISRLSVFGTVGNILAEKVKVDGAYATLPLKVLCAEAIAITEFVVNELVYHGTPYTPNPVNTVVAQPAQPAQTATVPPQPQSLPFPAATPRPEHAPTTYTAATAAPVTPTAPAQAEVQKEALFGVRGELDQELAARVNKMLGRTA
jgi:hypothetical protein